MINKYENLKVKDLSLDDSYLNSAKDQLSFELNNIFDLQAESILEVLRISLKKVNNKSIILYFSFLYAELKLKALYSKCFNINDLEQEISGLHIFSNSDTFTIGKIEHNVGRLYKQVTNNYALRSIKGFTYITKYLDNLVKADDCCRIILLEFNKNENKSKHDYTSLRYNITKNGEIVVKQNEVTEDFINKIEEALKYAI